MTPQEKKIRFALKCLQVAGLLFLLVLWIVVTVCDTPRWVTLLFLLPVLLAAVMTQTPWYKQIRKLPEERSTPRQRVLLVVVTLLFCLVCCWLSVQYLTDWQYRADAKKAKEYYRQGDYQAAWPYLCKTFPGKDPEIWYMFSLNILNFPRESKEHRHGRELLHQAAQSGVPAAVSVQDAYQELQRTPVALSESEHYKRLLQSAAAAGDLSAQAMLTALQGITVQMPKGEKALELVKKRPAQFLTAFRFLSLPRSNVSQGYSGNHLEYALNCGKCGGKFFHTTAFRTEGSHMLPPLNLCCAQCKTVTPLFDDSRDGYGARLIDAPEEIFRRRAQEKRSAVTSAESYEIIVSLEYDIDDGEIVPGEELEQKLPDCYTRFFLYGREKGKKPQLLFNWECA